MIATSGRRKAGGVQFADGRGCDVDQMSGAHLSVRLTIHRTIAATDRRKRLYETVYGDAAGAQLRTVDITVAQREHRASFTIQKLAFISVRRDWPYIGVLVARSSLATFLLGESAERVREREKESERDEITTRL